MISPATMKAPATPEQRFHDHAYALDSGKQHIVLNLFGLSPKHKGDLLAIVQNSATQSIDLYARHSKATTPMLCKAIELSPNLRRLDLENYMLENAGLAQLCTAMRGNATLYELSLVDNRLCGAEAGQLLAAMLEHNGTLVELNLRINQLRCEGVVELARGLGANTTLQVLNLGGNEVEEEGVDTICATIRAQRHYAMQYIKWGKAARYPQTEELQKRMDFVHALLALRGANACQSVGAGSALRRLPCELSRFLGDFL